MNGDGAVTGMLAEHDSKTIRIKASKSVILCCGGCENDDALKLQYFEAQPVYPVYLDTNVMAGRTWEFADGRYQGIIYLDSTRDNNPGARTGPVLAVPKGGVKARGPGRTPGERLRTAYCAQA